MKGFELQEPGIKYTYVRAEHLGGRVTMRLTGDLTQSSSKVHSSKLYD